MISAQLSKRGDVIYNESIVRRAQTSDLQAIMLLTEAAPTAARWSRAAYSGFCITAGPAQDPQPKVFFVACRLAVTIQTADTRQNSQPAWDKIVGFAAFSAVAHADAGECGLENMVVAEEWRRKGIGRRLVMAGLLWCRAWCPATMSAGRDTLSSVVSYQSLDAPPGSRLWLEVRASNSSAVAFYESAGFTVAGHRPAYYSQPTEDAILMWKIFDVSPAC